MLGNDVACSDGPQDATAAAVEKKYQEITPAAYEEQVPEAEQEEEVQKEEVRSLNNPAIYPSMASVPFD